MRAFYALAALGASLVAAVPTLEVQGNSFVNPKTGNRFQLLGVDYQPGGSAGYKPKDGEDPLTDADRCLRDASLMQLLGVNTIRVYNLSPNLNHDECASIFNAAGIYMAIDVNSPLVGESLTSWQPWESYYAAYLNRTFAVVEAFKSYPNTLLFFSGNEIMNDNSTVDTSPAYIRAVTRDLKNYIKLHSDRYIPVGYSAADVRGILFDTWNYLTCTIEGEKDNESRADLFALNSYSWCGNSTFEKSGFNKLVDGFKGSASPIFFSEFGCNEVQREFTEVQAIYGPQMDSVFSGGLVYEWTQEDNNYGLVKVNSNGSVSLLGDFNRLYEQYRLLNIDALQAKPAESTNEAPKCDSSMMTVKGFDTKWDIPSIPSSDGSDKLLQDGVSPAPVGKIVKISDFTVKHQFYDVNGKEITGIKIKTVADDSFNYPGYSVLNFDSSASKSTSGSASSTGSVSSSASGSSASSTGSTDGVSAATFVAFQPIVLGMAMSMALALTL
ncbi:1 3-beta-glucanosyltransferase gel2 [Ceratocystis lukuohia]|uniref:1,3-beta-glucanosyltransferase n=2 Tax=Ceratocystis TaxID=5157 RepID=A0A0F8B546_CERFI|nr:1 3-beta-glucanosyltransferase gel2 [Ceratocystis platani]